MAVPAYSHIVVVVEENHDYSQIIGSPQAPYINSLASGGALLTNYDAISHPSEPNYFALYAGSTFGITDDNHYSEPDPSLYTILNGAGKTFAGYVDNSTTSSEYDHDPWESFPEGFSVEKDFGTFPTGNFASLPSVSFVVPNVDHDMHNGTIQQGDTWLQSNINSYAQWAKNNNSLLVVTWDENDGTSDGNHVATIFYGADVKTGTYATAYNHYNLLSTLLAASNLTGPRNAATAAPIDVFNTGVGDTLAGQVLLSSATERTAIPFGTTIASFTDTNTSDTAGGFTATITWGDGTTSAGTISGGNGTFAVSGGYTYADEGSDSLSVAVTRTADGLSTTPAGTVAVAEGDTLTAHAATITATAGQALSNVTVASFTDVNTGAVAGDFAASINWGDGATTAGSVSGANGTFTVTGSHSYAAAGTDTVAVTLTDDAPGTATATASGTAQIGSAAGTLVGKVQVSSATEATALPSSTTIATFTDTDTADTAAGFTASIKWGDGTTSPGTVSGSNGSFSVSGGHTYADEGSFPLSATITRTADNTTITPTGTVVAAEADVLTPHAATITGTAGQALSNVTVATFTDTNTANVAGDFAASINWGDGATTAGSVSGANGTFTVTGSHSYAAAGTDTVAVTLTDDAPGTATATASSTAQIGSAAGTLVGKVQVSSATEATALPSSTTIATFTDTDTADTAAGFTASIKWGDGTTSPGTVSGSNGSFSVSGGHTYADEGSFPLSATITRTADNTTITPTGTVVAAEADVLTPHAATITGTAGQALSNVTVATFTDTNTANVAGDFAASINWGDGATTAGSVSGANGTFTVTGSHSYAAAGTDTVAVTLTDDAPGTATATASSTAQIGSAAGTLVGKVQVSSATEATALPSSTTIATFTDTDTADTAAGFTASIKWGDGTTSPGTVSGSNGSFSVSGGHTYADEGSFPLSATITRTADNTTITPTGTVVAAEADVLTPHAVTITGTAGQALSNVTVATFTDTNTANVAGDFAASINWGDGATTAGSVSGANGTFTVTGSHSYAAAGTDTVAVTLTDDAPGTATATASSTAQIGSAAGTLVGKVQVSSATEATALPSSTTIATFTDTDTADTAAGFTASIKWGDGTTSPGTVSGSNGSFSVSGGHTYADEGSFPLSATITRTADNTTITPTGTVVAAEADVLTPHAVTITGTAGQALSNVTVATFTDTNTANVAGDFAASINWGDGATTAGSVSGANGTFTVTGSHSYAAAGTDTVAVTLTDDAPGTATATASSTAQIGSAAGTLVGKVQVSSATEATALPSSTTIATFTDTDTADTAAGFTASIKWGDGTTSPGTVSGSNGSFSVSGGHTYADEGSFPLSATITRTADNTTITPTGTVVAAEADVLTPHAATITGTAGQALSNVTVATFTDTNTANVAGDFAASINWGDGATTAGSVSGANGTFTVTGSHSYAAAGTDTVAVTLTDDAPGTATATASSTAQIGSAAGTLVGKVQVSSATEATALPSSTTIATFTDTDTADTAAGFTASIKWGDGTTSPGTVSGSNGSFSVSGGHTYADEGSFPLSATITRTADNTTITPTGTVVAAEADVLTPHAATITGTAGQALSNVTVATFTDTNTANVAGDFAASINWGDGATTAGSVSGANGTFTVTGSHSYAAAGTDTVAVTLTDDAPGTATATASSTAQINSGSSGRTISSAIVGPIVMAVADTPLTVTSSGTVSSTGNNVDGIDSSPVTPTTVTNFGRIYATGGGNSAGVWLQAGGSVNNGSGAVISGGGYGVDVRGGSGTVTNSGTISGGNYAVLFDNSGTNRLVVNPAAVFNGLVQGGSGANTLELAGGAGTISGLSNGSGTVAENGGWSFNNFQTVSVDTGGTWVLNGGDVPTIANDGTIAVSGSLDVSSAIDLSSTGVFQLAGGSVLEVAAALGAQSKMQFLESSTLVIDSAGSFGVNVGTTSYTGTGPQLQHFTAGDTIDLKNFALAGATLDYNTSTGLLQLHNGISQAASLAFQSSSVGSGTFHFVSDGATGILITHA